MELLTSSSRLLQLPSYQLLSPHSSLSTHCFRQKSRYKGVKAATFLYRFEWQFVHSAYPLGLRDQDMAGRGGKSPICRHSIGKKIQYTNTMFLYILDRMKLSLFITIGY